MAPGTGIFFMRVGTHAQETLKEIVARKSREIEQLGYTFWGYGGSTCHPVTIVQPFARDRVTAGKPLYLCMEEMKSERYFGEPLAAAEFSVDGRDWQPVPEKIRVLGSRYALPIDGLRLEQHVLPLDRTRVPVGRLSGVSGSRLVAGSVDKACLVVEPDVASGVPENERQISLVANILPPYALLLRNFRAPE
jgi:hypothetical protein